MATKKEHEHDFQECLITYHYKANVSGDPFEITRHEKYCTKCGKIDHVRFEEDLEKRRIPNTDKFGYTMLPKQVLVDKYSHLPMFDVVDGEKHNNFVNL